MSAEGHDPSKPLQNARHEAFCRAVARGETCLKAYLSVFKCKRHSAESLSSRLSRNVKVVARIGYFQSLSATKTIMDMQERREICADVARDDQNSGQERIAACLADAKLAGELTETTGMTINNQTIMVVLPSEIMEPRRVVRRIEQGQEGANGSSSESAG